MFLGNEEKVLGERKRIKEMKKESCEKQSTKLGIQKVYIGGGGRVGNWNAVGTGLLPRQP